MCSKGFSSPFLLWLPRNGFLKILCFVIFAVPLTIQSIITWSFFIVLKNGLHHLKAQRTSFYLIYLTF